MRAVLTITSMAATRPPTFRGMSRWLTTPRRTPARISRTIICFWGGKNSTSRPIVSAASSVCSVEKTRWPDSAACSAVCVVSSSRSSPMRMTSGSWRRTRRSACLKDSVSRPTSRWFDDRGPVVVDELDRVLDRDDVLLAVAVDPVEHRRERRRLPRTGRARDENESAMLLGQAGRRPLAGRGARSVGISLGTKRKANEMAPRWRNPLTRKRPIPSARYEVSRSPDSRKSSRLAGERSVTSRRTVSRSESVSSRCSSG